MTLEFTSVSPDMLGKVKSSVWNLLKEATEPSGDPVDKIWQALKESKALLVMAFEGAHIKGIVVTEELSVRNERLLNIWAVAGEGLHNCLDHIDKIEAWAYENAFDAVVIEKGRPGWHRALSEKGYKLQYVYLRKDLSK